MDKCGDCVYYCMCSEAPMYVYRDKPVCAFTPSKFYRDPVCVLEIDDNPATNEEESYKKKWKFL